MSPGGAVVVIAKDDIVSVSALRANPLGNVNRVTAEITPDAAEEAARALLAAARFARAHRDTKGRTS